MYIIKVGALNMYATEIRMSSGAYVSNGGVGIPASSRSTDYMLHRSIII